MSLLSEIEPLVVSWIQEIIAFCEGKDEATVKYLQFILGASEENKTKIAITVEKIKAEQALGQVWKTP